MRVLLIHQAFASAQEAGGTRHFELARHCLARGIKLSIIASNRSYLSGRQAVGGGGIVNKQTIEGIDVYRARTLPTLHKSFVWRVLSFLSFMVTAVIAALRAGPVDLVMGTSPPIFQAVSAWVAARIKGVPFLLEIRDLWPEFAIDMGVLKNPILIRLSKHLESLLYRQADHILVNSPAYRDYMVQRGLSPRKVTLIPNGVETDMFKATAGGVRHQLGIDGEFLVTYAGALGMANDIPTLIRAAQALRKHQKIHFLILGDGKERPNLEKLAAGYNLTNLTFAGARPKSEMPSLLAASDACVAILKNIPMFKTTYPNKVFDYMAAGKPVVLAIDGVIRRVVEAAGGGIYVPPGDAEALKAAILELAGDPEKARRMGRHARTYVAAHFDRKIQAQRFIELVKDMGCR